MSGRPEEPTKELEETSEEEEEEEEFDEEQLDETDEEGEDLEDFDDEDLEEPSTMTLITSIFATPDGDTVCSALVNLCNQLEVQNKILIKMLSKMK